LPLYVLLAALLGSGLLWFTAPLLFSRDLELWELGVSAALASGLLWLWHRRQSRRQREQVQKLRDSALW
jgi:hypothetical protein